MKQETVFLDGIGAISENELEAIVEKKRVDLRAEKERAVKKLLCRIADISNDKKIFEIHFEIHNEFGIDICLVADEVNLSLERLEAIIVYRVMSKEPCPASEFGLCVFGFKDLETKEKCPFCQGYGTAEWDNY